MITDFDVEEKNRLILFEIARIFGTTSNLEKILILNQTSSNLYLNETKKYPRLVALLIRVQDSIGDGKRFG